MRCLGFDDLLLDDLTCVLQDRWVNVLAAQLASNEQLNMPSREDFDASDLNQDGTLLFDEWTQWVAMQ